MKLVVTFSVLCLLAACSNPQGDRPTESPSSTASLQDMEAIEPGSTTNATAAPNDPGSISTPILPASISSPATSNMPLPQTAPNAIVVSVTDGDTIRVQIDGVEEPVRLIGINAAEDGECTADAATVRLTELVLTGEAVTFISDQSDRDQFDRLLRYVYTGAGFVNEILVREGLALARRYEPDTAQALVLDAAQSAAEAEQLGMWAVDACGAATTANIVVGQIRYDADGNDNENLNDEWVELVNEGTAAADLTGWVVKDESASHRYYFLSGFSLGVGDTVRLHTGCGTDNSTTLYWCQSGSAVWNNSGDTVFLLDRVGNIVISKSY